MSADQKGEGRQPSTLERGGITFSAAGVLEAPSESKSALS